MKNFILTAIASVITIASFGQQTEKKPIFYQIYFPNAVHHEAEIIMTIPSAPLKAFTVRMSRSSAGRYATHEFGKNIYNVKATIVEGSALTIHQVEGDVCEIPEQGVTV